MRRARLRPALAACLAAAAAWVAIPPAGTAAPSGETAPSGQAIYRERCASCHGQAGEGVEGKRSRPLVGDRSVAQLARFIEKSMPEDAPGTCVGEEADRVARYIHDAFYSPIAQARNRRARLELSRLTVRQYRNAAADLLGSFRPPARRFEAGGLRGEYFNSFQPGRRSVLDRTDRQVKFDFGRSDPVPEKLDAEGFAVRWEGAVAAPDTGHYEFLVRTDHAARLWVNDARRPIIDAWVKSGADTEHRASLFLLGGRAYPLKLEFTSRRQGVQDKKKKDVEPVKAFIELHWKPPHGVMELLPSRHLAPAAAPEVFVLRTPFPPDDRSVGYERGTSISRAWEEAVTSAAIETAAYAAEHLRELGGIRKDGPSRETELREFSRKLVDRAFRRPLTEEEKRLYLDGRFAEAPDPETAVKRTILLALKSPRYLYLDLDAGARGPDPYAVASRLSFTLWDSLPDGELLEAAASGRLASREEVVRQAERMVEDPRTRFKLRGFLHTWLQVEQSPDLTKDQKRFPGFDESLASDLRTSLDLFLEEVVWGEAPDFRRLLLSGDLHLNGRAARYYGFDLAADAAFQKVSGGETWRAGVLSHPYLLARFAYADSSSPIHRGVFVLRSLLGRTLLPPPEAFAPLSPDLHPDLTTRERVAMQTSPEACQACHGMINPLGFSLERYDAAGRYREADHGKPVDASGSYQLSSGETRGFQGARELAEFLAASEEVHGAFVSQLFHDLVKQPILAYGGETPARLRQAFAAGGFNVRKLLVEIAAGSALAGLEEAAAPGGAPRAAAAAAGPASVAPRRQESYNDPPRNPSRVRSY